MLSTIYSLFVLSVLAPACVTAANDWSVPCVSGSCSWDTGDGKTTAYSSMAIGGTNNLLSDITPAAGWNIQGCDPNWANGTHTFQMTCSGASNQTRYCGHVYQGGAANTIVRLPENCGKGPFARIVSASNKTTIARGVTNSTANATIAGTPFVTLDYNFAQIPTSRGKASFAVTSTNLQGQPGVTKRDLDALRGRGRAGEFHRRRFASLTRSQIRYVLIGDAISQDLTVSQVGSSVNNAVSAVTSAAGSAASAIGNAVSSANTINQSLNSGQLTPVSFSQDVTLFDQSISCSSGGVSGSAELKIDVNGKADATVAFGVTVVGTIVPPQISDFSVNANLGGSTSATFNVDATADGAFDTGAVSLFKSGLPGLSIPSVITLGPEFSINGQVTIDLKAEAKLAIEAAWDFPSLNLVFPEEKGASTGSATVAGTNNPLQLSADPSVDVSGTVTAHIIPRIDFGVDLFSGTGQASVFIDADVSASLNLDVTAQATVDNNSTDTSSTDSATSTTAAATNTTDTATSTTAVVTNTTDTAASTTDPATSTTAAATNTTDTAASTTDTATSTTDTATSTTDTAASTTDTATSTTDTAASITDTAASTTDTAASTTDTAASITDTATSIDTAASTTDTPTSTIDTSTSDTAASTTDTATSTTDAADAAAATDDTATATDAADAAVATDDTATTTDIADAAAATDDPTDDPAADDPTGDPATDDPSSDPATDDPATDDSATDDFATDDPATDDSSTDDPATDDPATDDSATGDPATDDPATDDPATDDSSTDDSSTDDSSTDDSSTDDSSTDDSSTDDSSTDDSSTDDSATDDSTDTTLGFRVRSRPVLGGRDTSGSLNGCVTLNGAISINGGLQGSLAPFFNTQQETFPIFSNDVQLFQKCLNGPPAGGSDGASGRRRVRRRSIMRRTDTSGLQCPTNGVVSALTSLI
ncbi:hypothetical protein JB92DRAFT_3105427 [Gautieria morchelliformis]|nr:hypothetical protein JB92DRAFT_3105427 [Gautieria morchelliformis]